jgi:hypothetical protein
MHCAATTLLVVLFPQLAACLDNGFLRPAMGWNPWNCFGTLRDGSLNYNVPWAHGYGDSDIRQAADILVATNLSGAGYQYVQLDCGWTTGYRDTATGASMHHAVGLGLGGGAVRGRVERACEAGRIAPRCDSVMVLLLLAYHLLCERARVSRGSFLRAVSWVVLCWCAGSFHHSVRRSAPVPSAPAHQ